MNHNGAHLGDISVLDGRRLDKVNDYAIEPQQQLKMEVSSHWHPLVTPELINMIDIIQVSLPKPNLIALRAIDGYSYPIDQMTNWCNRLGYHHDNNHIYL